MKRVIAVSASRRRTEIVQRCQLPNTFPVERQPENRSVPSGVIVTYTALHGCPVKPSIDVRDETSVRSFAVCTICQFAKTVEDVISVGAAVLSQLKNHSTTMCAPNRRD